MSKSNKIYLLPDNIANQIAAGEVIQRPSSALKEMLENSIDSEANNIQVFIKDSGKTLIHVIDNGSGMNKPDAIMSFKRHATSKIRKTDDLFKIETMGFRGEAMASMAAISHIEMITKKDGNTLGSKLLIEGDNIINEEDIVCNTGTSIKMKNIFFNVPARRKFLKSDNVETKHIIEEFIRVSLANPNIELSLTINGKKYLKLLSSNLRQRIVNILGEKGNEKLIPIREKTNIVSVDGFVVKPEFSKRTRSEQYFFVNKRFIKSHYLNHAIYKAYEGLIGEKYYPSFYINLEVSPSEIDVNIHPTKTEIKFENEKEIYAILRSSIKKSLGQYNIAPSIDFNTEPAFDISSNKPISISEPKININPSYNPFEKETKEMISASNDLYKDIATEVDQQGLFNNTSSTEQHNSFFQINNQYIVSRLGEILIIVHQQRAHQRILYESYLDKSSLKLDSQKLVFPKDIDLPKKDIIIITDIKDELHKIGFNFTIENNKINISSVPNECLEEGIQNLFEEIIEHYKINEEDFKKSIHKKTYQILSRNAGIKSGRKLNQTEMSCLISDLMKCNMPHISPFGKITYFNIKNEDIIKKFN